MCMCDESVVLISHLSFNSIGFVIYDDATTMTTTTTTSPHKTFLSVVLPLLPCLHTRHVWAQYKYISQRIAVQITALTFHRQRTIHCCHFGRWTWGRVVHRIQKHCVIRNLIDFLLLLRAHTARTLNQVQIGWDDFGLTISKSEKNQKC